MNAEEAVVPGCGTCQRLNALIGADRSHVAQLAHKLSYPKVKPDTRTRFMGELKAAKAGLLSTRSQLAFHLDEHVRGAA